MPKVAKLKYDDSLMGSAIIAVHNGMSKRGAARHFNVPKSTLIDKFSERSPLTGKVGKNPSLFEHEEQLIIE